MPRALLERVSAEVPPCQPDRVEASELLEETWLLRVARSNFERFAGLAQSSVYPTQTCLTWGSLCSGSEGAAFVMRAIENALSKANQVVRFSHSFSCEINKEKRSWISCVAACEESVVRKLDAKLEAEADCLGADSDASEAAEGRRPGASRTGADSADADANGRGPGESGNEAEFPWLESSEEREAEKSPPIRDVADTPCLFTDIGHMSEKTAPCCCHGSKCNVPSVDLLLVGTSCKDLSKANPNKSQDRQRATFSLMHSRGGSAQTFRGLMGYLKNRRPSFVVFENVDTLDESSQSGASNQHILMDEIWRSWDTKGSRQFARRPNLDWPAGAGDATFSLRKSQRTPLWTSQPEMSSLASGTSAHIWPVVCAQGLHWKLKFLPTTMKLCLQSSGLERRRRRPRATNPWRL